VADRTAGFVRRLARHGDDLDDLLGAEGGRAAGARGVVEDLLDQGQQLRVRDVVHLGLGQRLGGGQPAVAPEADGDPVEAEVSGGRLQARVGSQGEKDEDPADEPLWGGLPLADLFEQGTLPCREDDAGRGRTAHEVSRSFASGWFALPRYIASTENWIATPGSLY
jgi:hypothetical protein